MPSSFSVDPSPNESLPVLQADVPTRACCAGLYRGLFAVCVVVTLVSIGTAAYFAGQASKATETSNLSYELPFVGATAAVSSEKFSMATGAVSEEAEGLFVLDHNSGLLQCSVLYPRMAQIMGQFTVNVGEALGTGGKGGSYVMLTGAVDFPRSSSNPAAPVVVYVLDTATGNFAGYGVPFNQSMVSAGRPQQNMLRLIFQGTANPVINRDALR